MGINRGDLIERRQLHIQRYVSLDAIIRIGKR